MHGHRLTSLKDFQYWRLITHQLAFVNSSDLFLAELILYNVAVHIERRFGSIKYAVCSFFASTFRRLMYAQSFLFVSFLVATLLQFITIMLFHRVGINHISLGPMAVLFSILYQYSRIIPPAYTYRIFGIPLNNKSMNYILAFQVSCPSNYSLS
jgi:hypothetical protein